MAVVPVILGVIREKKEREKKGSEEGARGGNLKGGGGIHACTAYVIYNLEFLCKSLAEYHAGNGAARARRLLGVTDRQTFAGSALGPTQAWNKGSRLSRKAIPHTRTTMRTGQLAAQPKRLKSRRGAVPDSSGGRLEFVPDSSSWSATPIQVTGTGGSPSAGIVSPKKGRKSRMQTLPLAPIAPAG
ncbi:hypothetical protein C8Q78DRAFT_641137 [Trametes maxima]|nr:hypothetical protein C8Q78DRAFT_641137 [Trametes maxima]